MSKELEAARALVKMLEEKENAGKVELSTLKPGEVFKVAEHDFIVLEQQEGQTEVISKVFMAEDVFFGANNNYKESSVKELIESKIQPIIEAAVGAENIIEHKVDLTSVDMQKEHKSCRCKVRPITFDEARKFNNLLVDKNLDGWWPTCTPWSTAERRDEFSIAIVDSSGRIIDGTCEYIGGVRPFCILKSNIYVTKAGLQLVNVS